MCVLLELQPLMLQACGVCVCARAFYRLVEVSANKFQGDSGPCQGSAGLVKCCLVPRILFLLPRTSDFIYGISDIWAVFFSFVIADALYFRVLLGFLN